MSAITRSMSRRITWPLTGKLGNDPDQDSSGWVAREPSTGLKATYDADLVNGRYYGMTSLADLMSGTLSITPGSGLAVSSAGNKDGTAAAIAAFGSAWTVIIEFADSASNGTQCCLLSFNATDAPIFVLGSGGDVTGQARSFRTNSANSIDTLDRFGNMITKRIAVCRDGSGRSIAQNGCPAATTGTPHSVPAAVQWFRYFGNSNYATGFIRRITIFTKRVSDADLQLLSGPRITTAPYAGAGCMRGEYNQYCSFGANTLQYERTQAWTVGAAIKINGQPSAAGPSLATMVFCNVSATSVFPGYEGFIFTNGQPRVRIINDIASKYIEVRGSTNLIDNTWHYVFFTYDGSGVAAGIKIYVDGVAETMTTVSDTLGANSIIGGTQTWLAGNQTNRLGYYNMGFLDMLAVYNVAKDATFCGTYSTPASLPPIDGSSQIWCDFNEASGTTVTDYSGNGRNGTLSQSFMRVAA